MDSAQGFRGQTFVIHCLWTDAKTPFFKGKRQIKRMSFLFSSLECNYWSTESSIHGPVGRLPATLCLCDSVRQTTGSK